MTPVDRLNSQAGERLLDEAAHMRELLVKFAHQSIRHYLESDIENNQGKDKPGDTVEFHVGIEVINQPDTGPSHMLSIKLAPKNRLPEEGEVFLLVMIPVPEGLDVLTDIEPDNIPDPGVAYFSYTNNDESSHVTISREQHFFYIPSDTTAGMQIDEFDAAEEIDAGMKGAVVQSGLPFLSTLPENMINMEAVVQARFVVGMGKV